MTAIAVKEFPEHKKRLALIVNRLMSVDPVFYELLNIMEVYVSDTIAGVMPVETACTFGKYVVINPYFMNLLDDIEVLFVLNHEFDHYSFGHTSFNTMNVVPEDRDLLNCAQDYEINYRITNYRYYCKDNAANKDKYKARMPCIDGKVFGCYDNKYDEKWDFRLIFDDLKKKLDKNQEKKGRGKYEDKHLTPEEIQKLLDLGLIIKSPTKGEIASQISSAITKGCSMGGSVPDYLRNQVMELTEPQFDYYELLYAIVDECAKGDVSWVRPKRKMLDSGYYVPDNYYGKKFKFGMFFDLSGSIGADEINKMASEFFGVVNTLPQFEIHLGCFSDRVHEQTYKVFEKDDYEAENYKFEGTGGTDLSCITSFLKKQEVELDNLIVLTDGYTDRWTDPEYCSNTIFLCTTNVIAPFGRTYKLNL